MAAAAAQRLAVFLNIILGSEICGSCTGRTHQLIVVGGRRMSTSPGNNKEVEPDIFVREFGLSLAKIKSNLSQDSFVKVMKDLFIEMHILLSKDKVLYPTELSNLMATFIRIGDDFHPHNSKVVTVEMMRRIESLEEQFLWKKGVAAAVVSAFLGFLIGVPYQLYLSENGVPYPTLPLSEGRCET